MKGSPALLREMAEENRFDSQQIDEGCPDISDENEACASAWEADIEEIRVLKNQLADWEAQEE